MKITKEDLKKLIIQELTDIVATTDAPTTAMNDFNIGIFKTECNAVRGNLENIDKIVRTDDNLDRKTLIFVKENLLGDLYQGISFVEGAINDRLKDTNEG